MTCVLPSYNPATVMPNAGHSFKGDQDIHVDRLIVSSKMKEVQASELQERELVPYFGADESGVAASAPLQKRPNKKQQAAPANGAHHGLKRNVGERSAPSLAAAGSPKKENGQPAKHQRQGGSKQQQQPAAAAAAPAPGAQQQQGKKKGAQRKGNGAQGTPARAAPLPPPVASKFAGPAFTNSPTPECLPIPTSRFLMQDAADHLRSRLTL